MEKVELRVPVVVLREEIVNHGLHGAPFVSVVIALSSEVAQISLPTYLIISHLSLTLPSLSYVYQLARYSQ